MVFDLSPDFPVGIATGPSLLMAENKLKSLVCEYFDIVFNIMH